MWYIFDNKTKKCIMSSSLELGTTEEQTKIQTENIYNIWDIELVNNTIVPIDKDDSDESKDNNTEPQYEDINLDTVTILEAIVEIQEQLDELKNGR